MPKDISKIWVFRIIHHLNLEYILQNGIYYRNSPQFDPNYVNIGSTEIISRRDSVNVKCYLDTTVNQYIPFYFGVRTPMLYKIKTGYGVPQIPQHEIIYLCCSFEEITTSTLQWCYTDGNAACNITQFYNSVDNIDSLDWHSIYSTDWSDNNADGDHDRMRKKHSEFLVKDHVPVHYIKHIIVLTKEKKQFVDELVSKHNLNIATHIDTQYKYYYQ